MADVAERVHVVSALDSQTQEWRGQMLEKRKSIRRRTLLGGRVEVEKLNGWAVECIVRNMSDAGARIALPPHVIVPCAFQLGVSGAAPVAARLVWYKDGHAGVALVDQSAESVPSSDAVPLRSVGAEPTLLEARIAAIAAPSRRRPWHAAPFSSGRR